MPAKRKANPGTDLKVGHDKGHADWKSVLPEPAADWSGEGEMW
jgi:hypothetical protein